MAKRLTSSIVLATYNGARHLPVQLQSLLDQSRSADELIVSDDGSSDSTLEVIEDFASRFPCPVRIVRQSDRLGADQNFSKAFGLAIGDVILSCDQDDQWKPEKIVSVMDVFERDPSSGLVLTDADLVDESLRPLGRTLWDEFNFDSARQDRFEAGSAFEIILRGFPVYGCTMAMRTTLRDHFLPVPEGLSFDTWIGRIIAAMAPCRLIREPMQVYRQHAAQLTKLHGSRLRRLAVILAQNDSKTVASEMNGLELLLQRMERLPDSPTRRSAELDTRERLRLAAARLEARRSALKRIPIVLKCAVDGSYRRSARGLYSAAVDLLAVPERIF